MLFGQAAAGHRQRQLDVVGRVRRDEVDRTLRNRGQHRQRVAPAQLESGRIEGPGATRIGRADVGEERSAAVASLEQFAHDGLVHGDPAWLQLDTQGASGTLGNRCAEQRPAHPGEWVEHELARPAEELDQSAHEPWGLVRSVYSALGVAQLGWIGRRPDRLGEVEPLLAGQLVEGVARVRDATTVASDARSLTGRARLDWRVDRRLTGCGHLTSRGHLAGHGRLGGRLGGPVDGRFVQHGRSVPHAIVPTSRGVVQEPGSGPAARL